MAGSLGIKLTGPLEDWDNIRFLVWDVKGVRDSRECGSKVEGDDEAFSCQVGDGKRHLERFLRSCRYREIAPQQI